MESRLVPPGAPPAHGPRRALRRWGLRAALLLASLFLAEGALRAYLALRKLPQSSSALSERLRTVLAHLGDDLSARLLEEGAPRDPERRFLHPYHGWETEEGLAELERHLADGPADRERTYELWIVGGSVARIFAQSDGAQTLCSRLGEDPRFQGKTVVLRNYARNEFKEPQQVMLVGYLLSLGLRPDALIALDGFNEAAIGTSNARIGTHPAFPSIAAWSSLLAPPEADPERERIRRELASQRARAQRVGGPVLGWRLGRSALLGWTALLYVQGRQRRWAELVAEYEGWVRARRDEPTFRGPRLPGAAPDGVAAAILVNYRESSRMLKSICDGRGIAYLHVLQPTLRDEGSKPLSPEEAALPRLKPAWEEGVRSIYPLLRQCGRELRAEGIAFEDASDVFRAVTETLYFDAIHFGHEGSVLLAERIAQAFLREVEKGP